MSRVIRDIWFAVPGKFWHFVALAMLIAAMRLFSFSMPLLKALVVLLFLCALGLFAFFIAFLVWAVKSHRARLSTRRLVPPDRWLPREPRN